MYWYKICPFCKEGRLFVYKNLNTSKLYLHCEECERGYSDIQNLDIEHSFLTLDYDFDEVDATNEDIIEAGWENLNFNISDR